MADIGLVYAVVAIIGWGIGDFLIQRSARKVGDWEALFFVTFFAAVALYPFCYSALKGLSSFDLMVLFLTSFIILAASLLDFESMRVGKMAVVEPIYAMEVPVTIALATFIVGEHLAPVQLGLIAILIVSVYLISTKHFGRVRMKMLERGVIGALLTSFGMGASNFLYGFTSRAAGPLMVLWFTSVFMAVATFAYLLYHEKIGSIATHIRHNGRLLFAVGFFDMVAWIGYSASTLSLPIGLVTGLTESYIACAVLLGLTFNKEKLLFHQKVGLVAAVCAAITLALTTTS